MVHFKKLILTTLPLTQDFLHQNVQNIEEHPNYDQSILGHFYTNFLCSRVGGKHLWGCLGGEVGWGGGM